MKRIVFALFFSFIVLFGYSQTDKTINRDSVLLEISSVLNSIDKRVKNLDRYKLYPTENVYINLMLDTKTGQIHLLQWSLDEEKEGGWVINSEDLSYGTGCGTFELYPTQNIFQFLLLDKVLGGVWHVQWGFEKEKCWIRPIY